MFIPAQTNRIKDYSEPYSDLTGLKSTGVKTPLPPEKEALGLVPIELQPQDFMVVDI